tara:strand:+ start:2296 stop:2883 length:588 start_codon:yes stop_codon:yes gene_type:complete
MQIKKHEIGKLDKDSANARKHDQRNLEAIKKSLEAFGQQKPIVIDKAGKVIAGNGTIEAAKELGWTEIEAVTSQLDQENAKGYAIADNRTAELADWDFAELAEQLKSLNETMDLSIIGWEPFEFEPLLSANFEPPNPDEWDDADARVAGGIRPIKFTPEQREIVDQAIAKLRRDEDDESIPEARCIELICAEFLS